MVGHVVFEGSLSWTWQSVHVYAAPCMYVWIKWLARSAVRPDEIRRETHVAPPAVSVRPTH